MATDSIAHCAELPFIFAVASPDQAPVAPPLSDSQPELDPELSIYRKHTIALLRRYLRLSIEVGRLPSLIGRECFRSHTSYVRPHTFEDAVHFVIDVEHCLEQLDPFSQQLIVRVVLQEYSEEEAASLLRCGLRTVERRLPDALDRVTEMLLERRILAAR
jgi:DNA-directed RNA polymerase specialized sigma24 family protein